MNTAEPEYLSACATSALSCRGFANCLQQKTVDACVGVVYLLFVHPCVDDILDPSDGDGCLCNVCREYNFTSVWRCRVKSLVLLGRS